LSTGDAEGEKETFEEIELRRSALRGELAKLAGSLLCARGGEKIQGPAVAGRSTARIYDAKDAIAEAALLIALAWSPAHVDAAFSSAAVMLNEASIWPRE
jgi:hypothetical protein